MSSRAEQKAQARAQRLRLQAARGGGSDPAAAPLPSGRRTRRRRRRGHRRGGGQLEREQAGDAQASAAASTTVDQLLAGLPQAGNRLGLPTAAVTVTEYGDLECPVCRDFALSSENQLIANDVRLGRVKLVYRSLETATQDPGTFQTQQVAAVAAGQQQRLWQYVELFYHEQGAEGSGYVTEAYLDGLARQVPGLDQQTWRAARSAKSLTSQVQADEKQAATAGYTSTPTIVVQGPKGSAQPIVGVPDYNSLEQAIQQVA